MTALNIHSYQFANDRLMDYTIHQGDHEMILMSLLFYVRGGFYMISFLVPSYVSWFTAIK